MKKAIILDKAHDLTVAKCDRENIELYRFNSAGDEVYTDEAQEMYDGYVAEMLPVFGDKDELEADM